MQIQKEDHDEAKVLATKGYIGPRRATNALLVKLVWVTAFASCHFQQCANHLTREGNNG